MEKITLNARYGLKHNLEVISDNTFRAYDISRFSFEGKNEDGTYYGIDYIDFDGGPFIQRGYPAPWDTSKTIKEFRLNMKNDAVTWVDIMVE